MNNNNIDYPIVTSEPTATCPHPTITIPLHDSDSMPQMYYIAKRAGLDVDSIWGKQASKGGE